MPPPPERGAVHLWRASTRITPTEDRSLEALLSGAERAKAARFRRAADRAAYLASHALLRLVLSDYVGLRPEALELAAGEHGKPELVPHSGVPLSFSLSHSGDVALVAVSGGPAVGVDVEEISAAVDVAGLARSVLSTAELRLFRRTSAERRLPLFFRSWVRKEAVLKGCGRGLAMEPARVVVLRDSAAGEPDFLTVEVGDANWGVRDVALGDRYAAAVAAPGGNWTLRCFDYRWPETVT